MIRRSSERHRLAVAFAVVCSFASLAAAARAAEPSEEVILATTTSVRDSGLLDALLPPFRKRTGIDVKVIAVGSGAALQMGRDGNADLVLAHAPEGEEKLLADGFVLDRRAFAENFFLIAGPEADPAQVKGAASAVDAMKRIAEAKAPFVSRGDESGTHSREKQLWQKAGVDLAAKWPGYASTGSGMGETLQVAGEKRAYVLTDEGTFRVFRERTGLVALSRPDPALRNLYSVLRVNPAKFPPDRIHAAAATRLADYLLSPEARATIAHFGADDGAPPLFTPLAGETAR